MTTGREESHRSVDNRRRRRRVCAANIVNHTGRLQGLLLLLLLRRCTLVAGNSTRLPTINMIRRCLFPPSVCSLHHKTPIFSSVSSTKMAFATTSSSYWSSLSLSGSSSSSPYTVLPMTHLPPTVGKMMPAIPFTSVTKSALHMAAAEIGANRRLRKNNQQVQQQQVVASSSSTRSTKNRIQSNDADDVIEDSSRMDTTTSNNNESATTPKKKKDPANTGRLRLLPQLPQPSEILTRSSRHADREAGENFGASIANKRLRAQKRGALNIDLFVQGLCQPLKEVVKTYNDENASRRLHPFERVVLELALRSREKTGGKSVATSLHEIHESRKELLQLSKDWIAKIKSTTSAREAYDCTTEARKAISQTFLDMIVEPWSAVSELQKSLRNVPVVRLDCPAVVLVGAPNVGKSSIVRAISSGTPEVNNYPFTTRGVTLGHVRIFWENESAVSSGKVAGASVPKEHESRYLFSSTPSKKKKTSSSENVFPISQLCQIMDSPGVLRRDASESRNEMEELTLAAMSHLPTAVVYVMDLSGGAGDRCSSVEDQLVLRRELRARYPRRPWIDVLSKSDLGVIDGARERLVHIIEAERRLMQQQQLQRGGGSSHASDKYFIELSIKEGMGVEELRQEVMRMLGEVRVVLDAMAAVDERSARST
ncbi:hypothetical protein ACHAWU_003270 [Discostella pseudostelligera]|uniref:Uncharacterized protein n=1 Tax=Discostella pseudostelligera TaxID=259834 RepID=A0ABD3MT96_9STRA